MKKADLEKLTSKKLKTLYKYIQRNEKYSIKKIHKLQRINLILINRGHLYI